MKLSEYCPGIGQVLAPVMGEGAGLNCITLCHIHLIAALGAKQSLLYHKSWNFYQCVEELHIYDELNEYCPAFARKYGPEKEALVKAGFSATQWLKLADWARARLKQHKYLHNLGGMNE